VQSPDLLSSTDVAVGIDQEMKSICPSCKLVNVDVPFNQWSTRIQTAVGSAVTAHPDASYVLPVFDGMVQWAVPAITAGGKAKSVHVATYNADPFALVDLKNHNVVTMDLGESYSWLGYALADQTLRILTGHKPLAASSPADLAPVRVFTSANISATGNPPTINKGYGNAYLAGYQKVWGG
jgi:ribose transport system substrate-binding protein